MDQQRGNGRSVKWWLHLAVSLGLAMGWAPALVLAATAHSLDAADGSPVDAVYVDNEGKVGIGTTGPINSARLSVLENTGNAQVSFGQTTTGYTSLFSDASSNFYLQPGGVTAVTVLSGGNVGLGTASPTINGGGLEVSRNGQTGVRVTDRTGKAIEIGADTQTGFVQTLTAGAHLDFYSSNAQHRMRIDSGGNVGIGGSPASGDRLHVAGNAKVVGNLDVTGNLAAKYQDVAEWVAASRPMLPGTVAVLSLGADNQVLPSAEAYDTRVAGVVSTQPGLLLGEPSEDKVKVATTGRVKVRATTINGPIRRGDLLVTSDQEGIAMRSAPLDFHGTPLHRPGTVLGKALEPLAEGEGEILVLLTLQ